MLNVAATTRVFVALHPADLRQSFNGLYGLVQRELQQDPLSGHLFVFTNRCRNRVKLLYWDGSGLWVCAKRLEKGRFTWPQGQGVAATLRSEELTALLGGLEVRSKAGWYRRQSE
jgi:transposase